MGRDDDDRKQSEKEEERRGADHKEEPALEVVGSQPNLWTTTSPSQIRDDRLLSELEAYSGRADDEHFDPSEQDPMPPSVEGVLAPDPEETRAKMLEEAVLAEDVHAVNIPKKGLWVTIAIIAVVLILAAVGGILGAVLGRKDTDDVLAATAPTDVPTTDPPTPLPTSPRFDQIASLVEGYFGTVLEDPLSPQYRAAEWLADVDTTFDPTDEARFRQRYSIVVFYYATGGATWASQTNFLLPGVHECNWTEPAPVGSPLSFENLGVAVCGEQDHILAIQMGQNNLTGYLPEEIGALTRLALISIIDDNLEGPLPSSLFELRDLTILAVPFNNFTGTIPTSIGQLTQLLSIWFQDATFESPIPSEIGLLTDLTHITMATCSLHGSIPESMKMLSNLESLTLSDNELTGTLSDSFPASWPNLSLLNLAYNNLNGSIPQNIGEMSKLQGIGLNNNYQLTGSFPDSLANLPLLEVLYVDNNLLTGSLPNYWSGSTMLSELSIFNNLLTGSLPPSLGELMALRHLNLGYNGNGGVGLNGTLPTELGNATNLRYLALDWNDFTGTVPQIFKNLTFLRHLSLRWNRLSGDISFLCDDNGDFALPDMTHLFSDCLDNVTCPCCSYCCSNYQDACEIQ